MLLWECFSYWSIFLKWLTFTVIRLKEKHIILHDFGAVSSNWEKVLRAEADLPHKREFALGLWNRNSAWVSSLLVLAWRIRRDRGAWQLQSLGWQRVGHDWATKHSTAQSALWILDSRIQQLLAKFLACWACPVNFRTAGAHSWVSLFL